MIQWYALMPADDHPMKNILAHFVVDVAKHGVIVSPYDSIYNLSGRWVIHKVYLWFDDNCIPSCNKHVERHCEGLAAHVV
jgi:hypothetical protein